MEKKAPLEEGVARLEERMNHLEGRMAHLEGMIEGMRNELNHLRNDFRMLLWIQIGSWVTLMAAVIGLMVTIITSL